MIVAGIFQAHKQGRKIMNDLFKEKGYVLKEKRFVCGEALGYAPNLKDMTLSEMQRVIQYLKSN